MHKLATNHHASKRSLRRQPENRIHHFFQNLNSKKSLPVDQLPVILHNMACYLDCLPLEAGLGPGSSTWTAILTQLELLFRRLVFVLSSLPDVIPLLHIMVSVLRVPLDSGGMLPPSVSLEGTLPPQYLDGPVFNTGAADCMRQHLNDALDFLSDFHTLSKIKSYSKGMDVGLNEDTLGGTLKSGVAQYVALEMMRGNSRDNRAAARCLPWLYNTPTTLQQGQQFLDCVSHIRLLSWLLLGSLTHTALHASACASVPQDASCHIADHIQIIMAGFAEQPKASVLHMSSLFHAFVLCQLWTVYLEQSAACNLPSSEAHSISMSILFDFWGKVTPSVLQLVSHSKILAEMVNLHFLSLLEALVECNSAVLSKLMPIWSPVLFAHYVQLPGHLQVRLTACRNLPPSTQLPNTQQHPQSQNPQLLRWLQRLQFKMGQIELQSATANQFYSI